MDPIDALAVLRLVPELFQITKALEAAAPGRHFTPDGHLVGSIGEAVAAARYGLELTTACTEVTSPLSEVQINRSNEVITLEDKHLVYHLQLKLSSTLLSDHLNEWGKG